MKKLLLLTLILCSLDCFAQRTLPYPIIFIHGLDGSSSTWDDLRFFLQTNAQLTADPNDLSFDLNADQNNYTNVKERDVVQYQKPSGNYDFYTINFEQKTGKGINQSNQAAPVKQGFALKFAISQVLNATGADKVILFGHSMGGLAAREYLQTRSNWQSDGKHHIAKLITLGTPHGGSDLGSIDLNLGKLFAGLDERSEAVRDLRHDYKNINGVYLFGGNESAIPRVLFTGFYNFDVNCNGYEGDLVQGLNQKDLYTGIAYSCIIGQGKTGIYAYSDGVVKSFNQNLNNYYNINADLFYHSCDFFINPLSFADCHLDEPKKALFQSVRALDEPSTSDLAYQVSFGQLYKGLMTVQSDGSFNDTDRYKFDVAQNGKVTLAATFASNANANISIYDINSRLIKGQYVGNETSTNLDILVPPGTYYVEFSGNSDNGFKTYNFNLGFCEVPFVTSITVKGPTTFCEVATTTLVAPPGFDTYTWYKDGIQLPATSSTLDVNQSGLYDLTVVKCDVPVKAVNSIIIKVNPQPVKPTVTFTNQGLVSSSTSGNQWLNEYQPISGAISQTFSAIQSGTYSVVVTKDGCSAFSDPYIVTGTDEVVSELKGIYPNPNNGVFAIRTPVMGLTTVEVIDLLGRKVHAESFQSSGNTKSIHLSPHQKGLYILRLKVEDHQESHKLIVE